MRKREGQKGKEWMRKEMFAELSESAPLDLSLRISHMVYSICYY